MTQENERQKRPLPITFIVALAALCCAGSLCAVDLSASELQRSPITNGAEWKKDRPVSLPGARREAP